MTHLPSFASFCGLVRVYRQGSKVKKLWKQVREWKQVKDGAQGLLYVE